MTRLELFTEALVSLFLGLIFAVIGIVQPSLLTVAMAMMGLLFVLFGLSRASDLRDRIQRGRRR
jgi:hypothetical protein